MNNSLVGIEIEVKGKVLINARIENGHNINVVHKLEDKTAAQVFLADFKAFLQKLGIDVSNFDEFVKDEMTGKPDVE